MRSISQSCAADALTVAVAMAAERVAMTVAEPCISTADLCARSNLALTSDFRGRLMSALRENGKPRCCEIQSLHGVRA